MERDAVVVVDGDTDGEAGDLPQGRIEIAAADGAAQRGERGEQDRGPGADAGEVGYEPELGGEVLEVGLRAGGRGVGRVDR